MKNKRIHELKKLWKYFETLICEKERHGTLLTIKVSFYFDCDVRNTEKLLLKAGFRPEITGKSISVKTRLPNKLLDEIKIKDFKRHTIFKK